MSNSVSHENQPSTNYSTLGGHREGVLILEHRFDMGCDTDFAMYYSYYFLFIYTNILLGLNEWILLLL